MRKNIQHAHFSQCTQCKGEYFVILLSISTPVPVPAPKLPVLKNRKKDNRGSGAGTITYRTNYGVAA
jgi:hypothetical protein